jgi:hypothetical protein
LRECLEEHCKSPNGKTDTGAEPSPAYFNIIMHGEEEEVLDGTQLAADWTFSGLQKFGQGLLDRLKGLRLNNKLLEKVSEPITIYNYNSYLDRNSESIL